MKSLGRRYVLTLSITKSAETGDVKYNSMCEELRTVYQDQDGRFWINYLKTHREVHPAPLLKSDGFIFTEIFVLHPCLGTAPHSEE